MEIKFCGKTNVFNAKVESDDLPNIFSLYSTTDRKEHSMSITCSYHYIPELIEILKEVEKYIKAKELFEEKNYA